MENVQNFGIADVVDKYTDSVMPGGEDGGGFIELDFQKVELCVSLFRGLVKRLDVVFFCAEKGNLHCGCEVVVVVVVIVVVVVV